MQRLQAHATTNIWVAILGKKLTEICQFPHNSWHREPLWERMVETTCKQGSQERVEKHHGLHKCVVPLPATSLASDPSPSPDPSLRAK